MFYLQALLNSVEHQTCDIQVELAIEFANSRRAGYVYFGHIVANDVDPGEQDALITLNRPDPGTDPTVSIR